MNNNLNQLDMLSLFGTYLGVMNYYLNSEQANNDDLLKELKHQDREFLQKILKDNEEIKETQKEILKLLKEVKDVRLQHVKRN